MKPGYVTPKDRLEKLRRRRVFAMLMRLLEQGNWEKFLLKCQKAKHRYPSLETYSGEIKPLLMKVNVVRMAIRFHVLVLAGEAISLSVPEGYEEQRTALNDIRNRSHFDALLMQAVRTANIDSFSTLRVDQQSGKGTVICSDENMMMIPVGPDDAAMQPTVWERRWMIERKQPLRTVRYLRVERHSAGKVEQEVYEYAGGDLLVDLASDLAKRVDLKEAMPESTVEPVVETGVPYPLVTRLIHEYFNGEPEMLISEHDLDLLDMSAAAVSRLDRSMEKHGSPKVRIGEGMIDPDTGKVHVGDAILDPDGFFEYISQQFDFGPMFDVMNKSLQFLAAQLQLSPALIGIKLEGGAMPDTFDKLRLEASNTIARGKVSARYMEPAIGRVFDIASMLDTRQPMRGYAVAPVGVTMHPGLPKDAQQIASEVAELRGAPGGALVDRRTAVEMVFGTQAAAGIMERLLEEDEASVVREQRSLMLGFQGGAA
jgi:transposase